MFLQCTIILNNNKGVCDERSTKDTSPGTLNLTNVNSYGYAFYNLELKFISHSYRQAEVVNIISLNPSKQFFDYDKSLVTKKGYHFI